ncbi:MAG: hypothetical protein PHS37_08145, partial [Candidatus Omnitrophica bacterium]|nr:hypothetical protein [Candidatus Omnitrophota bacterium]
ILGNMVFSLLACMAGLCAGVQYPLSNAIYLARGGSIGRSVAVTYAVDLAGACLGSLVASAVVIPVAGVYQTAGMLAVLNCGAFFLLRIGRTRCAK